MACLRWVALWILFPSFALAQTTVSTGTIQGTVLDRTGAVIPEARVTARNENTQATRIVVSEANGRFTVAGLPIGTYTLTVEKEGFSTVRVERFLLSVGQTLVQRLEMQPAGVVEAVEVKEQPEAVDLVATTSSVAQGYDKIEEAPASGRNYLNFVLLSPGVASSSGSSAQRSFSGVRNPWSDSGFSFAGMRGRNNSISIDGTDNRDETTGGNRVAIGLEMVREFRVAGSAVGAEFGGAAGGLVNVVTRSGVNLWHGDATFFLQNERFDAKRPEVQSEKSPKLRRYQPGTSISGPVRKDRTFISAAIESEWESSQEWSAVPEGALETLNRALRTPQFSGAPVRSVLRGLYDVEETGTEFSSKLDHQIGVKDSLSVRYAFSRGRILHDVQGPENFSDRSAQGSSLTTDHSLVGNWVRVVSPTTVSDFRIQVAQRSMNLEPNAQGAMLEIPGVATFGQAYLLSADRVENHYQAVENWNFVVGSHRLSTGVDVHGVTLDSRFGNRFGGIYIFPTLADFERGRPDVFIQAFGEPKTRFNTIPLGLWLHDRWELRPGLSLEAGLRYDRQRMPAGLPSSTNNWAPRLGLAWRPPKTRALVVRAGFGLFYDRFPLAFLNDALQKNGGQGFEQYAVGDEAARAFALGRGATLLSPAPGIVSSVYRASKQFPSTHSRKFVLGVEQGLGRDTSLSFEASHVRGFHLPRLRNITGTLPAIYELEQTARSDYQGASLTLNRRMSQEMTFLVAYNVGRTKDDGSDFDEQPFDPFNLRRDWARSRQHQLHRLAMSGLFELPVEELKSAPMWFREVFEGIAIAPIYTVGSGRPINALATTDLFRTGAYPLSARPFGLPRNPFYSPRTSSLDLRLMKIVPIQNRRAFLRLGATAFNLLNHSNTLRVSPYYAAGNQKLSSYGETLESLPGRQVQFHIEIEY